MGTQERLRSQRTKEEADEEADEEEKLMADCELLDGTLDLVSRII